MNENSPIIGSQHFLTAPLAPTFLVRVYDCFRRIKASAESESAESITVNWHLRPAEAEPLISRANLLPSLLPATLHLGTNICTKITCI